MGENQPNNNAGRAVERVTAHEAAALLGVHYNTVRNRIKAGMYRAEKIHTENGPTWMIERDSLTDNAPTSAPQQPASGVPALQQEAIQELARAIVREAGISREDVERLEGVKALAELFRTVAFLDTALLAGMAATVAFLPTPLKAIHWLYWSVAANILVTLGALMALALVSNYIVGDTDLYDGAPLGLRLAGFAAPLIFAISLVAFLVFVGDNLGALP